jgi:SPP1 gp7 family putative phage head morphogenesis protein
MAELYGQWSANTQQAFVQAIRLGVAQGETVQQMIVRVRGSATGRRGVYAGGILQTTTRGAEAMVRTAVAHVNHEARQATYAENEDLFSGYQYVATLDAATCLVCGPLDGKVYAVGENIPLLPQHYNCRCVLIPIVKSWKELGFDRDELPPGTRASMDGQVPEKTTYAEWLGRQSEALQNEILGKGRAELFRAGTPIDDMRSDRGRILTLQELREVDN